MSEVQADAQVIRVGPDANRFALFGHFAFRRGALWTHLIPQNATHNETVDSYRLAVDCFGHQWWHHHAE